MQLDSLSFKNNQNIPSKYTCDGENINPSLTIEGVPEGTKSLVLVMDDPDAPGGTFVHWTVWNIDPKVNLISEGKVPSGIVQGVTSFGSAGYGGPCPPAGTHRYFFKLYAIDTKLELDSFATAKDLESAIEDHILDKAELVGLYAPK